MAEQSDRSDLHGFRDLLNEKSESSLNDFFHNKIAVNLKEYNTQNIHDMGSDIIQSQ